MPTYEYRCTSCGRTVEAVQSFRDPPLEECPHCGGRLKRVFHPVGVVLKGSGFYSTDNRSSAKKSGAPGKESKESSGSGKGDSSGGGSSEGGGGSSKGESSGGGSSSGSSSGDSSGASKGSGKPSGGSKGDAK